MEEKKVQKVVTGSALTKKKSGLRKLTGAVISGDMDKVKDEIWSEVLIPAIKKTIGDIVKNGTDILLNGEAGRSRSGSSSKVSYRKYYDDTNDSRSNKLSVRSNGIDYDDIIFTTRGDAEAVIDAMIDIIERFGVVSVNDLYDLADVSTNNYTLNKYGWTNLQKASVIRVNGGYMIKLPKAMLLD